MRNRINKIINFLGAITLTASIIIPIIHQNAPTGNIAGLIAENKVTVTDNATTLPWHIEKTKAFDAQKNTKGGINIIVAVLDTGIDANHEDLTGKVIDNINLSQSATDNDVNGHGTAVAGIIAGSLEKFATEIRHLQRTEVREAEEPFSPGQTGSSAMPHKRNPELCERVCGLARLVRGYAMTSLENIALWHERDISHSSTERIILPDACLALDYTLSIFTGVMKGLLVYPKKMRQNMDITRGLLFSQRVLLALIDKGMTRQDD